ncbi:uncharacterized protein B0I36DRAFT_369779 [Microdochium trichocladiopsis]|uniref:Protein kinase domain-containing protein n=1 Tax=Microdochium trichocladiopsis TaxID=1682393 RepID=A0A9P9BIU1_9PEZI|nr:uncharacterized protein B0I36DRAFT_369779 [Microdochium trichocladiopsis]KAH7012653.1 hypothetical protein B0I36DRAFT_369779 [Microdochium trichocladiopsis]
MDEELQKLRQLLREAESRREEEQRRREEEQRRREEEQRRREVAEELATASQPQDLQQYLEACHSLNLAIQVVTDQSLTTQGDTTNPTGRIFPRRIIPWDDFATRQGEIWDDLSISDLFSSLPTFPSQHQLEYVRSLLKPISSELGLRDFERDVIENAVQKLVDRAYMDPLLRSSLGLQGTVTFESHTNLGTTDDDPISEPLEHMSLGRGGADAAASASASAPKPPGAPKARRRARGKGNRADQFCIYRTSDGQNAPALAIEYKAPHKLSVDEVVTGLESEIRPERDVINNDGQGFAFTARALTAAVVTQLFSYMIGKGIQYGYVCTGEAFVFLHIPDDPATVYFSVCVPNLDVMDDDETRLHRTAAAQVFAFILQALRARPPPESWHDEAERLDTWAVEYDDILRNIPVTERKRKEPRASPYKPQRWKGFKRSPIRTRSRCQQLDANVGRPEDDDEDPPSPTPNPSRTGGKVVPSTGPGSGGGGKRGRRQGEQREQGQATKPNIQGRPFCTQQCLLGLAFGGPTDENCPNSDHHGQGHIDRLEFLRRIRDQLAMDRGRDADCAPLHRSGARGSLFKVRLSTHGYTLVAKGMEGLDRACMQHENEMYDRLRAIQGKHIPVCLGSIDLIRPYYYDSGVYVHFMFLSWAGRPLFDCGDQTNKAGVVKAVTTIFKAVHKLRVLHRDAEPRNILCDTNSGNLMVVDFERAEFRGRQPLGSIGRSGLNRKRKRGASQKQGKDDFARELESAVDNVSSCVVRLPSHAVAG